MVFREESGVPDVQEGVSHGGQGCPQKLEKYPEQEGILWSTGRFDSSSKFKSEDVEMTLPFYDDSMIAPVVPAVRESSGLFCAY